jgi:ADP-dependent NAD(P)H-hydrate dehydratase / NAD(P)H-hydrate epimerase
MLMFPPLLTAAQMRAADAAATSVLGVPSLLLMENAGRGIAGVIRRELETAGDAAARAGAGAAIVCGAGSNGGDGFVAARHLARAGVAVRVALTAPAAAVRGDAAVMLAALERMGGVPIADGSGWTVEARWRDWLADGSVVVDAIFGTGFHGAIAGVPAAALAAMNAARARKIAVDIPSGLDADSGRAEGVVFRADVTATMGACKLGLYVDAEAPVGRVEVVELGVPILSDEGSAGRSYLLDEPGVAAALPRRRPSAHKGSSGHLLVVAGAPGKTGAAVLVGQAALRTGAGLVTLASTAPGQAALDAKVVELMTARYTKGGEVDADQALVALTALADRAQAIAIGPGIPTGAAMQTVVRRFASTGARPMVLDADALNALGTDAPSVLAPAPAPRILTPHPAEMGRLTGLATGDVQADRLGVARGLAAATRAIVVLKGARTVIAAPDGRVFVSPIACSALATAGSGDVLCGVVGAFLAGGVDPLVAAQIAVYVHGRAGEALAADLGDGVAAGDIPLAVASVIARLHQRGDDRRSIRPEATSPVRAAARPPRVVRAGGRRPRRPSPPRRRRRS